MPVFNWKGALVGAVVLVLLIFVAVGLAHALRYTLEVFGIFSTFLVLIAAVGALLGSFLLSSKDLSDLWDWVRRIV